MIRLTYAVVKKLTLRDRLRGYRRIVTFETIELEEDNAIEFMSNHSVVEFRRI